MDGGRDRDRQTKTGTKQADWHSSFYVYTDFFWGKKGLTQTQTAAQTALISHIVPAVIKGLIVTEMQDNLDKYM